MTRHDIVEKGTHLLRTFVPAKVIQSRLHQRVFMHFAEKIGLVYFGYVDQRSDDHRLVRGLTVSAHHRDNHYCIGSFGGYDMMLVERVDTIRFPDKPPKSHDWIIMTFDLHTSVDLPHIFLGLHTHSETFYAHLFTKFSNLHRVLLGTFGAYDSEFTNRYAMYTEPAHALAAQQLINQTIARTIGEHFGSLTVEIADSCVYLYAEHQRPSGALLEKMATYGTWLARAIDHQADESWREPAKTS
jgi:hypothetical protein